MADEVDAPGPDAEDLEAAYTAHEATPMQCRTGPRTAPRRGLDRAADQVDDAGQPAVSGPPGVLTDIGSEAHGSHFVGF